MSLRPTLPSTAITKQANNTLNSPGQNIVKLQGKQHNYFCLSSF